MEKNNFIDLLKLSFKRNRAKTLFLGILISYCTIIFSLYLSFCISYYKNVEKKKGDYLLRTLNVARDDLTKQDMDYIFTLDNVENVSISEAFYVNDVEGFPSKYKNASVEFRGVYDNAYPKVVKGRQIESDDEVICPEIFIPISYYYLKPYKVTDFLYSKDILNKEFYVQNKKYKIVGLYSADFFYENYDACFIQNEELARLRNIDYENYKDYVITVTYSKGADVDKLKEDLKVLNYDFISPKGGIDEERYNTITGILIALIIILTIITSISIYLFIKRDLLSRKDDMKLYRVVGIDKKDIKRLYIFEYLIIFIIMTMISIIIISLLMAYINSMLSKLILLHHYIMKFDIILILSILFYNIILPILIVKFTMHKKLNIDKIVLGE